VRSVQFRWVVVISNNGSEVETAPLAPLAPAAPLFVVVLTVAHMSTGLRSGGWWSVGGTRQPRGTGVVSAVFRTEVRLLLGKCPQ
jgi:hypothetical protein